MDSSTYGSMYVEYMIVFSSFYPLYDEIIYYEIFNIYQLLYLAVMCL